MGLPPFGPPWEGVRWRQSTPNPPACQVMHNKMARVARLNAPELLLHLTGGSSHFTDGGSSGWLWRDSIGELPVGV
jgi:hypothetical protein